MSAGSADYVKPVAERGRRGKVKLTEPHPALFDPVPVGTRPSDHRLTPPSLFAALGATFDLDPAGAAGGDYVPARTRYTATDDGLAHPWHGLVWCNPPFSNVGPWAARMIEHDHGLLLAPLSPETWWCADALAAAIAVTPLPMIRFIGPDHTARHVSFGVMLYAFGPAAVEIAGRLPDTFVRAA